jgi:glutamate carboxypeptidase
LAAVREITATSYVPDTTSSLRILHRHPPMERTDAVAALLAEAQAVARELGFEVGEVASGGAGDANTTAAAGLPTIDGLAPIGGEAHGPREWLDLDSVAPRIALLAGLLARAGVAPPPG